MKAEALAKLLNDAVTLLEQGLTRESSLGISPEQTQLFFQRNRVVIVQQLGLLVSIALGTQHTTPGTRLRWSSLIDWLEVLRQLRQRHERHPSRTTYRALAAHWAALTEAVILQAIEPQLGELKALVPKGRGDGQTTRLRVRLLDAIERRRQILRAQFK